MSIGVLFIIVAMVASLVFRARTVIRVVRNLWRLNRMKREYRKIRKASKNQRETELEQV